MINRIIFAAGGTGGHIYPAIAIADELKKMNGNIEIKFIGAKGRLEEKIVPQNGYMLETIEVSGFKRSLSLKNIPAAFKVFKALKDSGKIIKNFNPELVYGTGGYVSGPVLKAAQKSGVTTVVEEGNFYPGVTVKLVAPKADKVIVNFEGTKKFLKRQDNIAVMSYPVRGKLKRIPKTEACGLFGLEPEGKVLFVFGGSQGAHSINNALLNCFEKLTANGIQIIWQTGENDFSGISDQVKGNSGLKVFKYIEKIDTAYSAADLVLCRSGISTIMELAGFGAAAVFVPFPAASENHQEKNAMAITEKKAAGMIEDNELDMKLEKYITGLINDNSALTDMRNNIKQFADSNAAGKIARMLFELVNSKKK